MAKASGFIETEGYVPIFRAVDAIVKSTDVTVTAIVKLGGGIVAVGLQGDLATVEEAVAVGERVANEIGRGRCRSIIFANPCEPVEALAANPRILV